MPKASAKNVHVAMTFKKKKIRAKVCHSKMEGSILATFEAFDEPPKDGVGIVAGWIASLPYFGAHSNPDKKFGPSFGAGTGRQSR